MTPIPQPATKPPRRWFQFSVRTLLVGTGMKMVEKRGRSVCDDTL